MRRHDFLSERPAFLAACEELTSAELQGLPEERALIERELERSRQDGDLKAVVFWMFRRSRNSGAAGATERAHSELIETREIAVSHGNVLWEAITCVQLYTVLEQNGKDVEAIASLWHGIELLRQIQGCEADLFRALFELASELVRVGDAAQARSVMREMFDLPNVRMNAFELNRVGSLFSDLGDHETAVAYYQQALQLRPQHPVRYPWSLYGMARAYRALGRADEALTFAREAMQFPHQGTHVTPSVHLTANCLLDMGRTEEALAVITSYLDRDDASADPFHLVQLLIKRAQMRSPESDVDAMRDLERALSVARLHERLDRVASVTEEMLQIAITTRDGDRIQRAAVLYRDAVQALQRRTEENSRRNARMLLEIHRLEGLRLARRHQRELRQATAAEGERVLVQHAAALAAITRRVEDFVLEVERLTAASDPPASTLAKVEKAARVLRSVTTDVSSIEAEFHRLHPSFQIALLERVPSLTRQEVRICSLLRLGLSSEAIAHCLTLSVRSIENHRLRIRKKLALTQHEDLAVVLASLESTE